MVKRLACSILILTVLVSAGCNFLAQDQQSPTALPPIESPSTPTTISLVQVEETELPFTPVAPMQSNPKDECGNPFYPVVSGASWTYQSSLGKAVHSMTTDGNQIFTISIKGTDSTATVAGSCTEDGIVLVDVPGVSVTWSDSTGGSAMTTTNDEGVTLPNDVQVGDDWSQDISLTSSTLSAKISTNYKAVGFESVTVPAGTFLALKVEQTGSINMGGDPIQTHGYFWYAQGIGTVKSGIEGIETYELVRYSIP